ncbi:acyltransferase family protein [Aromatoleum aromaticum]|nr:acyltransferase family protein [Aromatoleum aromaticum]NMG55436.1 acyltransferase family protein [Aromatoleum aromaticum]
MLPAIGGAAADLTAPSQTPVVFRHDINGLRAWAVMVVVLFHFSVPGFSGGFVGVDVFFVISGYLMTGIIIGGLDRVGGDQFSLFGFYLARAKRILPALLVLCAVLLALGWFALASPDYRTSATHALFSLTFVSNMKFWREAGYFDAASHDKWLLHTWSLSVEWQFYLILPIALMLVWRYFPGRRNALIAMGGGLLVSLLLSVVVTGLKPTAAFFLLPTRAWEMLAGGVVFLLGPRIVRTPRQRRVLETLGFALILASVATASAAGWPGYEALMPVLGSSLVLIAARQQSGWTAPVPFQALGNWSYSIYLWHWPVVVGLVYLEHHGQGGAIVAGVTLSILLGWLSYQWVETTVRRGLGRWKAKQSIPALAVLTLLVALPATAVRMANGAPGRLSPAVETAAQEAQNVNHRRTECHTMGGNDFRSCLYGGPNVRAILVGDSHASTVVTSVQAALASPQEGVLAFSYTSCPTLFGVQHPQADLKCAAFNEWVMQQIKVLPSEVPVIVVNRGSAYPFGSEQNPNPKNSRPLVYFDQPAEAVTSTFLSTYRQRLIASVCRIAQARPVYLVRPFPEMPVDVPRATARKLLLGKDPDIATSLPDYHHRHQFIWEAQDKAEAFCGARILDPLPWLCAENRCDGADEGRPRYYDDNHLSEHGNRRLILMFAEVVRGAPRSEIRTALTKP